MANVLEEKLREASCVGDLEAVETLISHNVNINAKNNINGWTPLHWAAKRGNEEICRVLINNGADPKMENLKGETPADVSSNLAVSSIFRELGYGKQTSKHYTEDSNKEFTPNYINNVPLKNNYDMKPRILTTHSDLSNMPTTALPSQADDLVLKARIAGSIDPDFIEIEIPKWKLTYSSLLNICCEELDIKDDQVERIRKLPNTRLRKDSDVKRLTDFQCLEIVVKGPRDKYNNGYQSISVCKDQTILY